MLAPVLSCSVAPAGVDPEGVDPRDRRRRRYPLVALVRAAACAVAAGTRSYAAVGHWLRRAPQDALARLSFPARGVLGCGRPRRWTPSAGSSDSCIPTVWPCCCGPYPSRDQGHLFGEQAYRVEPTAVCGRRRQGAGRTCGSGTAAPGRRPGRADRGACRAVPRGQERDLA
ncbi:transposase family protein [Streptomyces hygroscopicus]|uniref:transposase family protein n=1 Tax=Streptomyces hygroscopicus TaxID=1912 RepID=UPI003A0FC447